MEKITYEIISLAPKEHRFLPLIFHTNLIIVNKYISLYNWHNELEILTVLSGNGVLHCNNKDYPMEKGDVLVINSRFLHSISTDSEVLFHCMIFDSDFCSNFGIDTSKTQFETHIKDEKLYAQLIAAADNITLFRKDNNAVYLALSAKARLLDALAIMSKDYSLPPEKRKENYSEADTRIKKTIEYISKNITEEITLDGIASAVGISKYHLSREFKRITDITVFDFIIRTRINFAKELLKKGYSVSESAISSGFENLSYFSRKFREIQGILPSRYAKLCKSDKH